MKFNKIIIDGNNLYAKNYFVALQQLNKKESTKLIYLTIELFLNSLRKIKRELATDYTEYYFLWDNAKSKLTTRSQMDNQIIDRRDIDPGYKLNRNKKSDTFYRGIDYLRYLLQNRDNYYYDLRIEYFEADDTVKGLIDMFIEKNLKYKIIIVSEDMDWSRCIDENIFWYSKNKIWTNEDFYKTYKFPPISSKIIMYKTFKGDKSDNIPIAVPSLKTEVILRIVNDFDNIYTFLANFHTLDYINDHFKKKIDSGVVEDKTIKDRLRLNYQMVDFIPIEKYLIEKNLVACKRNESTLKKLYKSYDIPIHKYEKLRFYKEEKKDDLDYINPKKSVRR